MTKFSEGFREMLDELDKLRMRSEYTRNHFSSNHKGAISIRAKHVHKFKCAECGVEKG